MVLDVSTKNSISIGLPGSALKGPVWPPDCISIAAVMVDANGGQYSGVGAISVFDVGNGDLRARSEALGRIVEIGWDEQGVRVANEEDAANGISLIELATDLAVIGSSDLAIGIPDLSLSRTP